MTVEVLVRRGSRLGQQTATLISQVRGQHNSRHDGDVLVIKFCVLVPQGASETQDQRASTETRWSLFVPRTVPADVASWVCTVDPGPVDAAGAALRMAVAGPAEPYWKRSGRFSHTELTLRSSVS